MRVLVTDARLRKSLAAVRSLGRSGVEVVAAGESAFDQALHSRHAAARVTLPSPQREPAAFLSGLVRVVRARRCDVVLPMSDHATAILAAHADRLLPMAKTPVGPPAAYYALHDKQRLVGLAGRLGIETPNTFSPRSRSELAHVAGRVSYPCVVKPRLGAGAEGVWFAASAEELLDGYGQYAPPGDAVYDQRWPLVQDCVRGEVHDAALLFDGERVVAAVTQRRLATFPPSGGPGIHNETTREPHLAERLVSLVRAAGWRGPALAEFILDEEDGKPKLLEVNPRFWGTLDLAITAGADFPWLACRVAVGDTVPAVVAAAGVRYRWVLPYSLSALARGRWRATGLDALVDPNTATELRARDWRPHASRLAGAATRALRSALRGIGR